MNPYGLPEYEEENMLGRYVQQLRLKLSKTITAVANEIGINHGTISRYESGDRTADPGYVAFLMTSIVEKIPEPDQVDDYKRFFLKEYEIVVWKNKDNQ